jgi:carboxymethylenebutenolidase
MTSDIRAYTTEIAGLGGDPIEVYVAAPDAPTSHGSVVVIHHLPGFDEQTKEIVRKFAANGYAAAMPNLYSREAPGASADDAAAIARSLGGVPDARLVGDVGAVAGFLRGLPGSNAKVGVIGYCSGGRQSVLAACSLDLDAAVDCYGAFVVADPPSDHPLSSVSSLAPLLANLSCPLLGLFGAEDMYPSPEQTETLRTILTENDKTFEFHTFEGAGHAFFAVERPSYRPESAVAGWNLIWAFFARYLS